MQSKTKIIVIFVAILLVLAIFLGTGQCDSSPTGHIIAVGDAGSEEGSEDSSAEPLIWHNGTGQPTMVPEGGADGGSYDPEVGSEGYQQDEPYCGDGVCNGRESCARCQQDCACEDPGTCMDGECVFIECFSDEDCVDDDACSVDVCYYPGHKNAYCSDEMITERIHRDGCCPPDAYMDVDIDCGPVCGNGRCEMGEHTEDCEVDCKYAGASGGGDDSGSGGQTGGRTTPN
ncbi:hypothetical protein KY362_01290 [Candidatus Woesearchaeota archaeon]|nr:hypothetical protein [Candidatus Woesearchaeota archaeon]